MVLPPPIYPPVPLRLLGLENSESSSDGTTNLEHPTVDHSKELDTTSVIMLTVVVVCVAIFIAMAAYALQDLCCGDVEDPPTPPPPPPPAIRRSPAPPRARLSPAVQPNIPHQGGGPDYQETSFSHPAQSTSAAVSSEATEPRAPVPAGTPSSENPPNNSLQGDGSDSSKETSSLEPGPSPSVDVASETSVPSQPTPLRTRSPSPVPPIDPHQGSTSPDSCEETSSSGPAPSHLAAVPSESVVPQSISDRNKSNSSNIGVLQVVPSETVVPQSILDRSKSSNIGVLQVVPSETVVPQSISDRNKSKSSNIGVLQVPEQLHSPVGGRDTADSETETSTDESSTNLDPSSQSLKWKILEMKSGKDLEDESSKKKVKKVVWRKLDPTDPFQLARSERRNSRPTTPEPQDAVSASSSSHNMDAAAVPTYKSGACAETAKLEQAKEVGSRDTSENENCFSLVERAFNNCCRPAPLQ